MGTDQNRGRYGRKFEGLPALDAPLSPAEAEESFLERHEELAGRTRVFPPTWANHRQGGKG